MSHQTESSQRSHLPLLPLAVRKIEEVPIQLLTEFSMVAFPIPNLNANPEGVYTRMIQYPVEERKLCPQGFPMILVATSILIRDINYPHMGVVLVDQTGNWEQLSTTSIVENLSSILRIR